MNNLSKTGSRKIGVNALADTLGKMPPQATDLEDAVLGALMLERDALTSVVDILLPESFYKEANQEIYKIILQLFSEAQPIDIKTVTSALRKGGMLELVGGSFYIAELTSKVNSAANIEYHARVVAEYAIKREVIRTSTELQREAYEDTTDAFLLLDKAEQSLFEITESHIKRNYLKMSDAFSKAIKEIELKKDNKEGTVGVPSGFSVLDRVTSGWQPSDLIIIAARPGMGKTAFLVSALRNAAVDFDTPVAIFSLEMSSTQLINRMISSEAELESEKILRGELEEHEWQKIISKTGKLSNAPLFIDDTPGIGILELRAKCRRLVAQHKVKVVAVDYLQLMSSDSSQKQSGNREQEIASISRALKSIAKELSITVIALSQLNRSVETRADKKPLLSDLRESGSIEQDADQVMFLFRPEYYGMEVDSDNMPTQGVAEVIIAKNRNGKTDTVKLNFVGKFTKFRDLELLHDQETTTFQSKINNDSYRDLDNQKFPDSGEPSPF